ncbi:hypothetical protein EVAR_14135_1 [Eumeta japonica]|uniref:Uncharacterized protein n=1 Tax=Eumeta variegata TaxID=151549 RepID=A0A4C1UFQ0_EUMVA|nr:hypothetical protein EVAR_14135_1 [Eumeta japonica]
MNSFTYGQAGEAADNGKVEHSLKRAFSCGFLPTQIGRVGGKLGVNVRLDFQLAFEVYVVNFHFEVAYSRGSSRVHIDLIPPPFICADQPDPDIAPAFVFSSTPAFDSDSGLDLDSDFV